VVSAALMMELSGTYRLETVAQLVTLTAHKTGAGGLKPADHRLKPCANVLPNPTAQNVETPGHGYDSLNAKDNLTLTASQAYRNLGAAYHWDQSEMVKPVANGEW
jgi:hypothetical protein